jgi:hypothetical protein
VAAHYVLSEKYPRRKAPLDAALERSLAAIPAQEKSNARIWGRELGAIVYLGMLSGEGPGLCAPHPAR